MTAAASPRAIAPAALAALLAASALPGAVPAQAQSAEDGLAELDRRITRLEDLNAIERLQRAYGYFVDKGQWTPLSELFAEDATLEIGGKGLFLGKKRVLEYMQVAFGKDGTVPEGAAFAVHGGEQYREVNAILRSESFPTDSC